MNFTNNPVLTNHSTSQLTRDADLLTRICQGDEKALEQLYHHYYARLLRFITRITRKQESIDEVINDVMYVVWQKASSYDRQCKPSTWIFGIAYNKARQAYFSERHTIEESLDDFDGDGPFFEDAKSELQQLEINNWLESALATLSSEQRAVIELTYFEGLHYCEIAELMGCPENTVKTRMHHARKKLALVLKNIG